MQTGEPPPPPPPPRTHAHLSNACLDVGPGHVDAKEVELLGDLDVSQVGLVAGAGLPRGSPLVVHVVFQDRRVEGHVAVENVEMRHVRPVLCDRSVDVRKGDMRGREGANGKGDGSGEQRGTRRWVAHAAAADHHINSRTRTRNLADVGADGVLRAAVRDKTIPASARGKA